MVLYAVRGRRQDRTRLLQRVEIDFSELLCYVTRFLLYQLHVQVRLQVPLPAAVQDCSTLERVRHRVRNRYQDGRIQQQQEQPRQHRQGSP